MWITPTLLLLLAYILVSASPISAPYETTANDNPVQIAKRGASVVHFSRSPTIAHDSSSTSVRIAQADRKILRFKFGKNTKKVTKIAHKIGSWIWRRAIKETAKPFDVKERRNGLKGTDSLSSEWAGFDVSYSGPISVGTPNQETTVLFDTGSSDLVLPLSTCANCMGPFFDPSQSSTFTGSDIPYSITYEDETGMSGVLATDTVAVAGLRVHEQTFAAVSSRTEGVPDPYAGILGLGFLPNAASNSTPFFANLIGSGTLASNVFSFYMTRGGVGGSELCLGCVNSEKYTEEITYHPVVTFTEDDQPFGWDILSTGLSYESSQGRTSRRSNRKTWKSKALPATIDSGTTFIYVPKEVAKDLYEQIPNSRPASEAWGEGAYAFPCDSAEDIGTISFGFGDKLYGIDPRDFNAGPESNGSTDCVGGIFGDDLWEGIAVLGDAFLKNWYSVFDYDTPAVGFAKAM